MKSAPHPPPPVSYRVSHAVLGPLPKILGLSCKDAFELCSAQLDRKLTTGQSLRLRFHLMLCGICRHLPRQFRGLRELVRACERDDAHDNLSGAQLPPEVKKRIFEHLKNDSQPRF